ncbi:transposase, partial [Roseiconus lacunae]|uniref:transposase n=1 Tax=Roseiconus lacunae TaxID=2605694 RepID=UPI001E53BF09
MNQTKTQRHAAPVDEQLDPEVISFRAQFDQKSPLDEIIREGARRMLQSAIDAEVEAFIQENEGRRDHKGRRQVVKNGRLPEREVLTGAGAIPVSQGRVRDNHPDPEKRVTFTPSVLPAYLRKTKAIEELIPWLYPKGVSTGDFVEALQSLFGERAAGFSASVVVRLKEQWSQEYDQWSKRD